MSTATVFVQPDPFLNVSRNLADFIPTWQDVGADLKKAVSPDKTYEESLKAIREVGRPLQGISVKPNTHAFLQVIGQDGKPIAVLNQIGNVSSTLSAGGGVHQFPGTMPETSEGSKSPLNSMVNTAKTMVGLGGGNVNYPESGGEQRKDAWTDWILQTVREQRAEKTQIVETFGRSYLYAFGERPRVLSFTGVLLNTVDYNWRSVFWQNWDEYFRATKLLELGARVYISWDDILVEGYPLNAVAGESATVPNTMQFSFEFFVTNYTSLSAKAQFKASAAETIALSKTGYRFAGKSGATLLDNRISLVEWLGNRTATWAAGEVWDKYYDEVRDMPAGPAKENAEAQLGLASRSAGRLVDFAQKGLLRALGGQSARQLVLASLAAVTQDVLRTEMKLGARLIEHAGGFKPGEVNAWFGAVAMILDRTSQVSWAGAPTSDTAVAVTDVLRLGSIDRIVQAMGYGVVGGLSGAAGWDQPKANYQSGSASAVAAVDRVGTADAYYRSDGTQAIAVLQTQLPGPARG